ncbi:MAG: STAS domain-containing protein [Planctomycetota bacterium]|nr:STAS domain-containing protein [Planctomycetota bacterium]MDA1249692.1 STAS domain-containing protein [Planctomycetota bacterium]
METTIEKVEGVVIVTAQYESLDAGTVADFKGDVEAVIEDGTKVVLDLSKVEFVDSAGLGGIVWFLKQLAAQGGDLKVCGVCSSVRALFELIRMHRLLAIYNDRDEAQRAYQSA